MYHFIFAIIKTERIPCRMFTTCSRIEILIRITGKIAQTFYLVLHSMRVNNIHYYSNPQSVSSINQFFELFRSTETRRSRKETRYMVAKATVIRMFLNGHNLNTVVTSFCYTRKNLFTELTVSSNFFFLLSHTDMAFINK